jgi:predicted DNA-binding transcriptional regulator AlpA
MRTEQVPLIQQPHPFQHDLICKSGRSCAAPAGAGLPRTQSAEKHSGQPLAPAISYVLGHQISKGRPAKSLDTVDMSGAHRLLNVREAARLLGLSKSTLDKMRCSGRGPVFVKVTTRAVRYDPADLAAFANARRRHATLEDALEAFRD